MGALIRPETPADVSQIREVLLASFPTGDEARLVELLREADHLTISLVAEEDGRVVGHIAFSPVTAQSGATGAGLAPLAVTGEHRSHGVGAALVSAGIEACRATGFEWVAVLGDPDYYSRYGFGPAGAFGMYDEYGGGEAFQVLELVPGSLAPHAGLVRFGPEFALFD